MLKYEFKHKCNVNVMRQAFEREKNAHLVNLNTVFAHVHITGKCVTRTLRNSC